MFSEVAVAVATIDLWTSQFQFVEQICNPNFRKVFLDEQHRVDINKQFDE